MNYTFSDKISNLKPSAIREILKAPATSETISFAAGNPAPESFPVDEMERIAAEIFKENPTLALQYGVTDGYSPLREAISIRNKEKFNIGKDFDQTVIVSGGQQGIELACRVFCNEGDAVICEDPTFIGALNAFRSNGATPIGVPLTSDGIDTDALENTIKANQSAKLIYIIPNFQNPTGITTSYEKRVKVYELAKKYGLIILEDNPYGELRFAGEDIPTIKSLDTDGIVIYCSTFSKILSAGMRVGYVCAPEDIASKMVVAKQTSDVHTNLFFQILTHKYMTQCDLDAHIESIRSIYRRKCSLMTNAIDKYFPECIERTSPCGGLFIWCTLPDSINAAEFVRRAAERNVRVVPGITFNCDENAPSQGFRLNYSTPSDDQIERGIKILGELAREMAEK